MERFDVFTFDGRTFLVDSNGLFYLKEDGLSGLGNTKLTFPTRVAFGLPNDELDKIKIRPVGPGVIDPRIKITPPKVIPINNVKPLGKPKPDFLNVFNKLATSVGAIFGNKKDMVTSKPTVVTTAQPVNQTPVQPKNNGISKTAMIGITGILLIGGAMLLKKQPAA